MYVMYVPVYAMTDTTKFHQKTVEHVARLEKMSYILNRMASS